MEVTIPTTRPASLYKDLWLIRTHLKLAGPDLKFYKKQDAIVVRVEPQLDLEVLINAPASISVDQELSRREIATMLVNKRPGSVTILTSHLPIEDIEKLNAVYDQLGYAAMSLGEKTLLTLQSSPSSDDESSSNS